MAKGRAGGRGEKKGRIGKDRSARRFFQLGGSKGSCRVDGVVGSGKESHRRTAVWLGAKKVEEDDGPSEGDRGADGAGENWKEGGGGWFKQWWEWAELRRVMTP